MTSRIARNKPHTLRKVLERLERFCKNDLSCQPPYFHVSDPIRNDVDMRAVFKGNRLGYARLPGHLDHRRLERWLADFEGGAEFRVRSDGMGAIAAALFGAKARGSHFIFILPLYGGTYGLAGILAKLFPNQFESTFLYANDRDLLEKLNKAVSEKTAAVLFETIGNPTLPFPDIEGIIRVCHSHPKVRPLVICDDTFLFGLFKPLGRGVDVVVGSGTKYLVNESSWPLGYLGVSRRCLEEVPKFWLEANTWANLGGGTLGPFEAWATGKFSTRNILQRLKKHSQNAMAVAEFLESHPCVERVIYPGLDSYPWRERISQYLEPIDGKLYFGGMISFYIKGDLSAAKRFLYHLTGRSHIRFKASLAGPDDMIESPALLSHQNMHPKDREACGITENNIRLSVGRIHPARQTIKALDRSLRATINYPS